MSDEVIGPTTDDRSASALLLRFRDRRALEPSEPAP